MYAKFKGYLGAGDKKLKHYHHVRLDREFKFDCQVWRLFLSESLTRVVSRPMVDLNSALLATELNFFSDASANPELGFGAIFWEPMAIQSMGTWVHPGWPTLN